MPILRLLRAALTTVVTAAALVALPSGPAFACSCVGGDTRDFVDWADLVVVGTVVDHVPDADGPLGGDGTTTYTVEVDRVYEGGTTATTEITSSSSGASCGLEGIELGTRYVVFGNRDDDGGHSATLCGGTAPASDRLVSQVEAVVGGGRAPAPGGPPVTVDGWSWLAGLVGRLLGPLLA
jgi:hypothetical protein